MRDGSVFRAVTLALPVALFLVAPAALTAGGMAGAQENAPADGAGEPAPAQREPATPLEPATQSPSAAQPSDSDFLTSIAPSADLAVPALIALLIGALLALAFQWRSARRLRQRLMDVESAEAGIGNVLGRPGLTLAAAVAEIRKFERDFRALNDEHEKLKESLQADAGRRGHGALVATIVNAAVDALQLSATAADEAAADPDFAAVEKAIGIRATVATATNLLVSATGDADPAGRLVDLLASGRLNGIFALAVFLDGYFSDRVRWRRLRAACHCAQSALALTLSQAGVEVVLPKLLVPISPDELPGPPASDRRGIRNIPAAQRAAARLARGLHDDQCLIVDCHAPGWVSDKLGKRAPAFTIFDRSSWT